MKEDKSLKNKIIQGGIYLAIRQIVSTALSLASVLVVARILGPEQYGVVAIALGTFYFVFEISKLGLDVYVIREPNLPVNAVENILAFYNLIGVILCGLSWMAIATVSLFYGFTEILQTLSLLIPVVWIAVIGNLHTAVLERDLRFAEVSFVEMISQLVGAVLSIVFVLLGWGYWGPVVGQTMQFLTRTIIAVCRYPINWRLSWNWDILKPAVRYGLMYAGSNWLFALKSMTVPLFVAPIASLQVVGLTSMAIRFVDQLGTFRFIAFRVSISALAQFKDMETIRRSVARGMIYQGLMVGPMYVAFSCISGFIVPYFFGKAWLPSIQIFPCIAFAFFVYTLFTMHCSALCTFDRIPDVSRFHLFQVGLLWVSSFLLIPHLGFWGYPIAELVSLLSYISIHRSLVKLCGMPEYNEVLWLTVATALPLFAGPWLPIWSSLSLFLLSYASLFVFRPGMRYTLSDLYLAWQARKANPST